MVEGFGVKKVSTELNRIEDYHDLKNLRDSIRSRKVIDKGEGPFQDT